MIKILMDFLKTNALFLITKCIGNILWCHSSFAMLEEKKRGHMIFDICDMRKCNLIIFKEYSRYCLNVDTLSLWILV